MTMMITMIKMAKNSMLLTFFLAKYSSFGAQQKKRDRRKNRQEINWQ